MLSKNAENVDDGATAKAPHQFCVFANNLFAFLRKYERKVIFIILYFCLFLYCDEWTMNGI